MPNKSNRYQFILNTELGSSKEYPFDYYHTNPKNMDDQVPLHKFEN